MPISMSEFRTRIPKTVALLKKIRRKRREQLNRRPNTPILTITPHKIQEELNKKFIEAEETSYTVPSSTDPDWHYIVTPDSCTCPSFQYKTGLIRDQCKHMREALPTNPQDSDDSYVLL